MNREKKLIKHIRNCIKDKNLLTEEKVIAIKSMIEVYDQEDKKSAKILAEINQ